MTECPNCKVKMKTDKKSMTFKFSPNVIVQEIKYEFCPKCSFECVSGEEYERVRKLVHSVASGAKKAKMIVV
jgi:Zn-finger nucleic acid-binding protein